METILIADNHELIRRGIRQIIEGFSQPYHIVEADSGAGAVERLSGDGVRYAILEMLPVDGNVFWANQAILQYTRQTDIFVYSANPERVYARRLLQKGIRGYLNKQASLNELQHAIGAFLKGELYLSPYLKEVLAGASKAGIPDNSMEALSNRELEVVEHLITGLGTSEIARLMGIDISTVSTYRKRVFKKLDIENIMELNDKFLLCKI